MQRLMAVDRLHPCTTGADRPIEHDGDDAAGQFLGLVVLCTLPLVESSLNPLARPLHRKIINSNRSIGSLF